MPKVYRIPHHIQAAKGEARKRPSEHAHRADQAKLRAIGDPPKHMDPDARAVWRELKRLDQGGLSVLRAPHRLPLELLCNLVAEFRKDPQAFTAARINQLRLLYASLQLAEPLKLEAEPKGNPFDEF